MSSTHDLVCTNLKLGTTHEDHEYDVEAQYGFSEVDSEERLSSLLGTTLCGGNDAVSEDYVNLLNSLTTWKEGRIISDDTVLGRRLTQSTHLILNGKFKPDNTNPSIFLGAAPCEIENEEFCLTANTDETQKQPDFFGTEMLLVGALQLAREQIRGANVWPELLQACKLMASKAKGSVRPTEEFREYVNACPIVNGMFMDKLRNRSHSEHMEANGQRRSLLGAWTTNIARQDESSSEDDDEMQAFIYLVSSCIFDVPANDLRTDRILDILFTVEVRVDACSPLCSTINCRESC